MGRDSTASRARACPSSRPTPTWSPRCSGASTRSTSQFAQVEQIKKFTLVGEEWLPDSDVLTPTSKLKRRGVNARYADEIEAMYAVEQAASDACRQETHPMNQDGSP